MALNIKNERVIALAQRASALTGSTQTGAIELALTELIADRERRASASRLDLIWQTLDVVDAQMGEAEREAMQRTMDDLYGDDGLPA